MLKVTPIVLTLMAGSRVAAQDCLWREAPELHPSPYGTLLFDGTAGRMLCLGGTGTPGSVRTWTPQGWVQLPTVGAPSHGGNLVFDSGRGRIVQAGGQDGTVLYADTWEWDGLTWTLASEVGPAGRAYMAYDEARQQVVRFHNVSGTLPGQTWLWDGQSWTMATWSGPPSGFSPQLIYDPDRQVVMMLLLSLRQVWEWNGAAWELRDEQQPPVIGAAVYDRVRRRVLVHGYFGPWPSGLATTWEYDPATRQWAQRAAGGPRLTGQFVYDGQRNISLLWPQWVWTGSATITPVVITSMSPSLQLYPGQEAVFSVEANSSTTMDYRWYRNGTLLQNGGNISGVTTPTVRVANVSTADSGSYLVKVSNPCSTAETYASLFVSGSYCYANCDQSTAFPTLTANDFMCFLNQFANGSSYANCDGSTGNPTLTASDFQCYLNRYAAGCS